MTVDFRNKLTISYLVYVGILIGYGIFIYLVFPETKGLSAEAAALVFDGIPQAPSEESVVDSRNDDVKEDVYHTKA